MSAFIKRKKLKVTSDKSFTKKDWGLFAFQDWKQKKKDYGDRRTIIGWLKLHRDITKWGWNQTQVQSLCEQMQHHGDKLFFLWEFRDIWEAINRQNPNLLKAQLASESSADDDEKTEPTNLIINQLKANEIYADYFLHDKVSICSNDPYIRHSYIPSSKINYQTEGETLAVKAGVFHWLSHNPVRDKNNNHLTIWTPRKVFTQFPIIFPTKQAEEWWEDAWAIAKKARLTLSVKSAEDWVPREK